MKRICPQCHVISQDMNLWCQEKTCPAEKATEIYDNGEWFGPFEIIETVVILPSAIVYRARREGLTQTPGEQVLLKIANTGSEDKLRQESQAFLKLAKAGQHPLLPVLLPAHAQAPLSQYPYGWTVVKGKVKYYAVFKLVQGEILRSVLLKNPQPWYQHVGWIILSIADVILYLHKAGKLHLCLNPDMVLVRFDKQGIPRPILLDLGVGDAKPEIKNSWQTNYNLPAYTPPELLDSGTPVGQAADVYGLGMLLYEMLSGEPAYPYHLKRDKSVFREVVSGRFKPTGRVDLRNIPQIAERAIQRSPGQRFGDVMSFAADLRPNFPAVPPERKPRRVDWGIVFIVLGATLAITMLIGLALTLVPPA